MGAGPQGAVAVGHGDAGSLVDEDGEDEVLVGVEGEVASVALVGIGAVEEEVSEEVAAVVEVSEEADSGVHNVQYCVDPSVHMSRFECLDLACDSSKFVRPLVYHGNGLQKPHKYTVRQWKKPYLRQLS